MLPFPREPDEVPWLQQTELDLNQSDSETDLRPGHLSGPLLELT